MPELQIDGIRIATITTELAGRLRLALDQPHVRVTRVDISEPLRIEKPVAAPNATSVNAAIDRSTVAVSIETSSGLILTDISKPR